MPDCVNSRQFNLENVGETLEFECTAWVRVTELEVKGDSWLPLVHYEAAFDLSSRVN